jgi:site-specific DNA-methyltransferase (adenine-specific)
MKMYKVKLYDKEIVIIKDDDGKCIIPKQFKSHTALKPALEPITVAMKPIEEKTIAKNVLKYGTGGINIDGCRISINPKIDDPRLGGKGDWSSDKMAKNVYEGGYAGNRVSSSPQGRFPANLIHDGSEEVTSLFPDSKGQQGDVKGTEKSNTGQNGIYGNFERVPSLPKRNDSGSASRFFYCAKASKKDRNEGCNNLDEKQYSHDGRSKPIENAFQRNNSIAHNNHPTVKPTDLMQYLVKLVTPKNGIVLDPFMGSGSTGKACVLEGFDFIGIELDEEYLKIAEKRIAYAEKETKKYFNWNGGSNDCKSI